MSKIGYMVYQKCVIASYPSEYVSHRFAYESPIQIINVAKYCGIKITNTQHESCTLIAIPYDQVLSILLQLQGQLSISAN